MAKNSVSYGAESRPLPSCLLSSCLLVLALGACAEETVASVWTATVVINPACLDVDSFQEGVVAISIQDQNGTPIEAGTQVNLLARNMESGDPTGIFTASGDAVLPQLFLGPGGGAVTNFLCTEEVPQAGIVVSSTALSQPGFTVFECGRPCE